MARVFNAPGPIFLSIKRALIYLLQSIWNMKLCICNVTRSISFSVNIVFCYWPPTRVPLSRTGASVWLWGDSHDHVNCGQATLLFTFRNSLCCPQQLLRVTFGFSCTSMHISTSNIKRSCKIEGWILNNTLQLKLRNSQMGNLEW